MRRLKTFEELAFADDYMFCRVLTLYPDVAKSLLKEGISEEIVEKSTQLSKEEVQKIKQKICC